MYYTILWGYSGTFLGFFINKSKSIKFFLFFFWGDAAITIPNRKQFLFGSSLYHKCVKNGFQKDYLGVPDQPLYISPYSEMFLNANFNTLIMKLATKQKLFSVDYDCGSMLKKKNRKKFNTLGFINEKPQKSTRIALLYSRVHRRVSEFLSILFFL